MEPTPQPPSTALVHDWLVVRGGAERTLETLLPLLPDAPVYTLFHRPEAFANSPIDDHPVIPSILQRIPGAARRHRMFLPFYPFAVEQFDLRSFTRVISISFAAAHGVLTHPAQRHIAYICSPARYAWHLYHDYLEETGLNRRISGWLARYFLHQFRQWDYIAAQRPDEIIAISHWVAGTIRRIYRREASVIYPPVDISRFEPGRKRKDFYLWVGRMVPYKKAPLVIETCTRLGVPLVVVGDGPEYRKAARLAGNSVTLLSWQPDEIVAELMSEARALIYMGEEDFGITLVEAQAAGCPIIAFARGGAAETVIHGETGWLIPNQTTEALAAALQSFEESPPSFSPRALRTNAGRFSAEVFQAAFKAVLRE